MKKIIEKVLDKLLITKPFQDYVNGRITRNHLNQRFCIDDISQLGNIYSVQEYHTEDIRPDDVVLDLGANIGAFSLPVATKCKWVYSIDPLYANTLIKNRDINKIKNITPFCIAVGKRDYDIIHHSCKSNYTRILTLTDVVGWCKYKPTFLKIDIEGYEWFIEPEEFKGIRRIEGEIHFTNGKANNGDHEVSDMLELLKDYDVDYEHHGEYAIVHAVRR